MVTGIAQIRTKPTGTQGASCDVPSSGCPLKVTFKQSIEGLVKGQLQGWGGAGCCQHGVGRCQKPGGPRKPQVSSGGCLSILGEGVWPGGGLGQDCRGEAGFCTPCWGIQALFRRTWKLWDVEVGRGCRCNQIWVEEGSRPRWVG